jgi:hypothetical protein
LQVTKEVKVNLAPNLPELPCVHGHARVCACVRASVRVCVSALVCMALLRLCACELRSVRACWCVGSSSAMTACVLARVSVRLRVHARGWLAVFACVCVRACVRARACL